MRPMLRALIGLVIVAFAAIALAVVLSAPAHGEDINIQGLWEINTDLVYEDDNIIVRGDIWIRNGGSLTLRRSTLQMDSREHEIKTITVNETGNLYVYSSEIKNRFDYRYFFNVYNDTEFKGSTVRQLFGWDGRPGGIRLYKGEHIFDGCTITDSSTYGIWTRRPTILNNTVISGCSWVDLGIDTSSQFEELDIIARNCTFRSNPNDQYGYGVLIDDNSQGHDRRYINISYCNFEGNYYGLVANVPWQNGLVSVDNCLYDRCVYGNYIVVNFIDFVFHNNFYRVPGGCVGFYIYHGSYGNITYTKEDIRATSAGSGYGILLEGAGSVRHKVQDVVIWNTYYGIQSSYGPVVVRDCYINVTGLAFYVSGGSTIDVYTTEHPIGSGFVDLSGGRITAWQRLALSGVRWADGTDIQEGIVHLINETEGSVGEINLSLGQDYLDFVRWEAKRSYIWTNEHVFAALLDVDTFFRAPELDILETGEQEIVFTDDYAPRLTAPGLSAGMTVNRTYISLSGDVIERGQGLLRVDASIDGGADWTYANVIGGHFEVTFSLLPDAVYDLAVRAVDRAGNVGRLDFPGVILDTHSPFIELDGVIPAATNVRTLRLEGRTEAGATIRVGNLIAYPNATGAFAFDYPLTEGMNGLVILVTDRVGNTNQTVLSVLLDTIPPTLTITSPEEGTITNDGGVFVSGRTDSDASVTINGVPVPVAQDSFTRQLTLGDGTQDIVVRAVDEAGNEAFRTVTVTVDLTPPVLVIEKPAGGRAETSEATFYITGDTDEDIDVVFVNGERRTTLPGEFAIDVSLVEGTNEYVFAVVDAAGNRNETTVIITRDTTAPDYSIEVTAKDGTLLQSGTDRYSTSSTVVLHVTVDEDAMFTVSGGDPVSGKGAFTIEVPLVEGRNDIIVDVKDLRDNVAPRFQYTVHYDPTPPTLVVTAPVNGSRLDAVEVTIKGATDDAANKVWVNNAPVGVRSDGTFEVTLPLADGANSFTLKARDSAGNERTTSISVERKEERVVQETPWGGIIAALVLGLVAGAVLMFALGRGRGGKGPRSAPPPPPPPPQAASAGAYPYGTPPPQRPGGEWEEE